MSSDQSLHSAPYFGDYRDFWWNRDFLELMARRWKLEDVYNVLDVGCGLGHWGRCLREVLPQAASILGIDREKAWIDKCSERMIAEDPDWKNASRFGYQVGDANALQFDDDTFDLVTCQTLLIHVQDPVHVLKEMLRVTKPGGLVIAAEPNNRAGVMMFSSLDADPSIDDTLRHARFHLTCERGKRLLGLGDTSLGDLVPGLFAEAGASNINVYLSDKTSAVFPPYEGTEQQTLIAHARDMSTTEVWMWPREESERYFVAGGGSPDDFSETWDFIVRNDGGFDKGVANATYHTAGGAVMYLVSGRKSIV